MSSTFRTLWASLTAFALLFVLMLALASTAQPVPVRAQNTDCYHAQGGNRWVCDNGGRMEFQSGATLEIQDGATLEIQDGAMFEASGASIGSFLNLAPQEVLTLTMNGWLTPTGTVQPVAAAGAVSVSGDAIAPGKPGDLLVLLNTGANTITITETTGLVSAGNIALGAGDSATLIYHDTSWYQIGASNN